MAVWLRPVVFGTFCSFAFIVAVGFGLNVVHFHLCVDCARQVPWVSDLDASWARNIFPFNFIPIDVWVIVGVLDCPGTGEKL